jgi:hypothetical protein
MPVDRENTGTGVPAGSAAVAQTAGQKETNPFTINLPNQKEEHRCQSYAATPYTSSMFRVPRVNCRSHKRSQGSTDC